MTPEVHNQFIGGNFMVWFTGVVEDVMDPMQMGRVRVRCIGYHTADKSEIPTESLPWAMVMMPVTSASMSTIGQSATGILAGSWVIGFFRDGQSAQDPIVMGTIPSATMSGDPTKGFTSSPLYPGENDMPREARAEYQYSPAYVARYDQRIEKVEKAVPPKISTVATDEPDSYYTRGTWDTVNVDEQVNPSYPANNAIRTAGGHVKEMDDTQGYKRLLEQHASGTYTEVINSGTKTTYVVKDNYTVVLGSDSVYIKGACSITIDGDLRQLVKGNYHLEVEGNKTEYIKGSRQCKIGQSDQGEIGKDSAFNITGNKIERVGGDTTILRDGNRIIAVGKDSNVTVTGNDNHFVLTDRNEYTGGNLRMTSTGQLTVTSGAAMALETPATLAFAVDGNMSTTVGGNRTDSITGNSDISVSGNSGTTVSGNMSQITTGTMTIRSTGIGTVRSLARLNVQGAPLSLG
jgi:hypothetical protein